MILYVCLGVIALCLLANLVLILRSDDATRGVVADMVFYLMLSCYAVWTLLWDTSIVYEVILLGSLLGLLSTVSVARILSKGRR
ncbi:putative monovalent cation/H+ antiporter subunit F [Corynebacterium kalinowskii]|uniref:Monovalent cation/H+ antiporter subunit F n=1 Tax=Corynebacterium kalinowskii TaxID=2675216 RepID=A0A6B8VTU0_9CORY|nr:monovalent cation/H+ antiporter complex subunit F [Corynebacterium kalinowskii]QGU03037.1 putative monovalent cation/H+ antiporter subunit F [Corynebacterium kalinowskii]